jgi:NADH dehydrogenase/NADH:ubiquinone oxidoreductase subunit G
MEQKKKNNFTVLLKNKKMFLYTGALTSKPYAFTSRPWELRSVNSIDVLDGIGSNIRIDFKEAEIVRILPSRKPDINESWISDKIRFFYDGLKRQRIHLPFVKEYKNLKKAKWDQALLRFSSLLKVYSYEYGSSKIGLVLGSNLDCETYTCARNFASNFNFSLLGIDKSCKINKDNSANYKFQNQIQDLEKSDFCLLVGTNPRFEASILNLRLRKNFKRGTLQVAAIGGNFDPTYMIDFYGLSSKILVDLAEGKHKLCKSLIKANSPVIYYGWKLFDRGDSLGIASLFQNIRLLFSSVFNKEIVINALTTDSNSVGALELGLSGLKKTKLNQMKLLYGINIENKNLLHGMEENLHIYALQTSHGNDESGKVDFLFPSLTFTEKSGIYYNTEGRPQKTQKALSGPNLSKDDWKILNVLFQYLNKSAPYATKYHVKHKMSKLLPSSFFANFWFSKNSQSLACLFPFGKIRRGRILISSFKLFLEDFFMSNALCQSSKVMAKASDFLRSSLNNYSFLTYSSLKKV